MKKGILLLVLLCTIFTLKAEDRQKPTYSGPFAQLSDGENLYLYNTGAALFFCDGNDWNTHASVGEEGILVTPEATEEVNADGATVYQLRDYPTSKGYWCNLFFTLSDTSVQLYTDGNAEKADRFFCFETLNNKTFRIYGADANAEIKHAEPYADFYVAVDPAYVNAVTQTATGTGVVYMADGEEAQNVWAWVSQEDYAAYCEQLRVYDRAEELHALMLQAEELGIDLTAATAAYENLELTYDELTVAIEDLKKLFLEYYHDNVTPGTAIDLTSFIENPSFENGLEPWVNEAGISTFEIGNWAAMIDGNSFSGAQYLNLWNGSAATGDISQTLTGMPNGVYQVTAGGYSNAEGGYIFAGDAKVAIVKGDVSEQQKGQDYSVATIVADGTLHFGYLPLHEGEFWSCVDNFRLTYYGDGEDAYAYWVNQNIEGAPSFEGERCQQALVDAYNQALEALQGADTSQDVSSYITAFVDALNAVKANINAYNMLEKAMNESEAVKEELFDTYATQLENYITNTVVPTLDKHELSTAEVAAIQDELLNIVKEGYATFDLFNELNSLVSQMEELISTNENFCSAEALANAKELDETISVLIVDGSIENNEQYRDYINKVEDAIKQLKTPVVSGSDDNPIDYSVYIENNGFEKGLTAWTREGQISTYETGTWGIDDQLFTGTAYLNLWDAAPNGSVFQLIEGLPAGTYTLSVNAFSNNANSMVLFAGSDNVVVESSADIKGAKTYDITTIVTDGTLRIGIILYSQGETWCTADNFILKNYGTESQLQATGDNAKDILPTGIQSVQKATSTNMIYDLSGRRVQTHDLKSGLYIIDGRKVFIR